MLKTRILSAAVGIPIVVGAIFLGTSAVGMLTIATASLAGYEVARMSAPRDGDTNAFVMVLPLAMAIAGLLIAREVSGWWLLGAVAIAAGLTAFTFESLRVVINRVSLLAVLAAGYFGAFLAHAAPLRSVGDSVDWILLAILITYAADTASYFVGTWLGRYKLAPIISPSKTWEGAAGGFVAGIGAAVALTALLDLPIALVEGAYIGLAAAGAAVAGDLAESGLKRLAGVKDSGGIIPGHGGVLDRIDSLAPNLAVVYWMAVWLTP